MSGRHVLLAVHEDSNANAALFVDGRLVAAVAEERITRKRYQAGFPHRSVEEVLRIAGLSKADVTEFVAGNRFHVVPRLPGKPPPSWDRSFMGALHWGYLGYQDAMRRVPLVGDGIEAFSRASLGRTTGHAPTLVDHHEAHAYSAAYSSGWDRGLVVTIDNFGDGTSCTAWSFAHGALAELRRIPAGDSPGQFYGEIAELLGIHPLLAGKVTGLAARGDASKSLAATAELFSLSADGTTFHMKSGGRFGAGRTAMESLRRHAAAGGKADVAAAAQKQLEVVVLGFIAKLLAETGLDRVAVAGGVFGNVRLNQKIGALDGVREVWVYPAMSDAGIAAGAALSVLGKRGDARPARFETCFLGPSFTADECAAAIERAGLKARRVDDPEAEAAKHVIANKVVARFAGRLEYGPRALGNRSILYRTEDATVNDWLNKKLRRAEYMPFAPATLAEHAPRLYRDLAKAPEAARFMTVCFDCTDEMKRLAPACVHVDGTARPQVVRADDNPGFHKILSIVERETGNPSVVNTSFNMHEEPIVRSPDDALRAWVASGLDVLVLGDFVLEQEARA